MPLQINANHIQEPTLEYVAWVDVMGIACAMQRSMKIAANFMLKLHIAALHAPHANVRLYPIMDGFYASSPSQTDMLVFLRYVFHALAETFVAEPHHHFRFVIRGSFAFGTVVHGAGLPPLVSTTLNGAPEYRRRLLIGMPMIDSCRSEKMAPPFGVYVHESARTGAPLGDAPLPDELWRWNAPPHAATWAALGPRMNEYYDWCDAHSAAIGYPLADIVRHRAGMNAYLI